jgi:cation transport ATPase
VGAGAFFATAFRLPAIISQTLLIASVVPIATRALRTLTEEKKLGVDALDGIAATVMIVNGKVIEAAFMAALISLGEFIREQTARRCEKIVSDLLGLSGRSAWLVKGKRRLRVPVDEVKLGDIVVIYPGDMVPVDGLVISGDACVDQSKMTGEAIPVEVEKNSHVMAATVVVEGRIHVLCPFARDKN